MGQSQGIISRSEALEITQSQTSKLNSYIENRVDLFLVVPGFLCSLKKIVIGSCRVSENQKKVCESDARSTQPEYNLTHLVGSQTLASLWRIVRLLPVRIVFTPVGSSGTVGGD